MKCEGCPALRQDGYEYPETYCCIYPDSECLEFKDGSIGCKHKRKTIEKRLDEYEEIIAHQYDGIGEWYEENQKKEQAIIEAILYALDKSDTILAYADCDDKLFKYKGLPWEFEFRLEQSLEYAGYEIRKKE